MRIKEFTAFISTLAEKSGEIIRPYFAKGDLAIEMKGDQTLVTQADRQAEAVMRDLIRQKYPQHGILGEEFGPENVSAEFVWTLDPVDGTFSFARGCPLFGTLIGLLHAGKPILGVINHPLLDQFCIGNHRETTINGRTVRLREVHRLSEAMLLTTDLASVGDRRRKGFEELLKRTQFHRTWGDCYGYLLLASGGADIMLDPIMKPWDILPLIPIIQGANGIITTWSGTDASQGDSCVAANKALHPQVREILNSSE